MFSLYQSFQVFKGIAMRFCKVLLNGDVLFERARVMNSFFERMSGLMFKKEIDADALVFKDTCWIHSFFCVIPFNVLFIGKDFKILNHFTKINKNKILPPVWNAKYTIEYLGGPLKISLDDKIEIIKA